MYKLLISIFLVLNSLLLAKYEDTSPEQTTKKDIKLLQKFEKTLYSKTYIKPIKCNQSKIVNFINSNKIEKFDYNKLLVKLNGQINTGENFTDEEGTYKDRDRANIQLNATYPIFDKKTDIEIKKKRLKFKEGIINEVSKYCEIKNEIEILNHQIDLLNLKQIRAKAREDAGQIYLDERIELIEEIIDKKNDFIKTSIDFNTMKLQLINKVKNHKQNELEGLLWLKI